MILYYHDGKEDFPHGAGPSDIGWYIYESFDDEEPSGPFESFEDLPVEIEVE